MDLVQLPLAAAEGGIPGRDLVFTVIGWAGVVIVVGAAVALLLLWLLKRLPPPER